MPKKIKVNEIVKGKVEYVSLVSQGANRIPFRIYKQEDNNMGINLDAFELFKSEDKQPSVAAVIVNKNADLDLVKDRISKAGLSIEEMEESDKGFVFKQIEGQPEGTVALVKVDEDIVLQLDNVQKAFSSMNFETESFNELFSQAGVLPTLKTGLCVLEETILNIMYKSESPVDASNAVNQAITEFQSMAKSIIDGIPAPAFKIEDPAMIEELRKAQEELKKEEGEADEEDEDTSKEDEEDAESDDATSDEEDDSDVDGEDEDATDEEEVEKAESDEKMMNGKKKKFKEDPEEKGSGKKKKYKKDKMKKSEEEDAPEALTLESIAGLIKQEVGDRLDGLQESVEKATQKAESAEELAKSADATLNGTVFHDSDQDRMKKSVNGSGAEPFVHFDTAYGEPD